MVISNMEKSYRSFSNVHYGFNVFTYCAAAVSNFQVWSNTENDYRFKLCRGAHLCLEALRCR